MLYIFFFHDFENKKEKMIENKYLDLQDINHKSEKIFKDKELGFSDVSDWNTECF